MAKEVSRVARAQRTTAALGNSCFFVAVVYVALFFWNASSMSGLSVPIYLALVAGLFALPTFAYHTFAVFIEEGKAWAATAAIVLGAAQALIFALFLVLGLLAVQWQLLTLGAFMLLMILLMIVHCARALGELRARAANRGFQPVMRPPTRPDED